MPLPAALLFSMLLCRFFRYCRHAALLMMPLPALIRHYFDYAIAAAAMLMPPL